MHGKVGVGGVGWGAWAWGEVGGWCEVTLQTLGDMCRDVWEGMGGVGGSCGVVGWGGWC